MSNEIRFLRAPAAPVLLAVGFLLLLSPIAAAHAQGSATPTITVSPTAGVVGSKITVAGSGFPSSSSFNLVWETDNATWAVSENPPRVTGVNTTAFDKTLTTIQTSSAGSFSANLTVPVDYGGSHTIQLFFSNGTAIKERGLFDVEPSFTVSPTSGPAGTPITISAKGLGYGLYSTNYFLYWDNLQTGYFTAVTTDGVTNFTFYATGTPGPHYIYVYQGYPGPGYLNPWNSPPSLETQSEFGSYIPFHAEFNMTGDPSSTSSSLTAPALVVLAAALVSVGLVAAVSAKGPEDRAKLLRQLAAVIIVVAIIAAGAGAYLTLAPSSSSTTTTSSYTPQATVVRPAISVTPNPTGPGPSISISPDIASVGQNITVSGKGFQPGATLPLTLSSRKGDNILGFKLVQEPLRNVTASASGNFSLTIQTPPSLGGIHYISAGNLTRTTNGTLYVQRTASINATQGPSGTTVAVTMYGVGWTFNTNIATIDYDNSYIGYGCGFNSGGNVTFYVTVSGAPGIHTIDVYPSVWWGPSNQAAQLAVEYRYPLLTPQDGPALIPSFHFSFLITPGSAKPMQAGAGGGLFIAGGATALGLTGTLLALYFAPAISISRGGERRLSV